MIAQDDDVAVTYTVKELFERVDGRLVSIDQKLDTTAEKADLDSLEGRVSALEAWKWKLVGAIAVVVPTATVAANRLM